MNKKLLVTFCLFFILKCFSQENISEYDFLSKKESTVHYLSLKQKTKKTIKNIEGDFKKERKQVYKNKLKNLKENLNDSIYITNTIFNHQIKEVTSKIFTANPSLKEIPFTFLLKKDITPNASAHGLSFIEINLGLFTLLSSNDELAFVICHEIAHEILKHQENSIKDYFNSYHSKKILKEAKKISSQKENKANDALKKLRDIKYRNSRTYRKHEIQADSLGLVYLKNSIYDTNAANSVLKKLGNYEKDRLSYKINWKKDYGIDIKNFQQKSALTGFNIIDDIYTENKDSIRTHPHTKDRILKVNSTFKDSKVLEKNKDSFNKSQLAAFHHIIKISQKDKLVVLNFYLNNLLSSLYPNNKYYSQNLIEVIEQIYSLKKSHTLGKYVQSFGLKDNVEYDYFKEIRNFISNSELYHLTKIKNHIINKI